MLDLCPLIDFIGREKSIELCSIGLHPVFVSHSANPARPKTRDDELRFDAYQTGVPHAGFRRGFSSSLPALQH
ncbi:MULTISPECIES: hypothetical protein [Burkholderia]|uniref:hypothetical protein n=1 Tax=Burkholderia TaxID=32008 RepID=UPI000AE9D4CB|nr:MULTISPECIES: hypothetical protein [Burkholderia]